MLFAHILSCTKPLDDEALAAIKIGKQEILRSTSDKDLLVFLGNSASYFYHAVSKERDSYLIPISGRYRVFGRDSPDKKMIKRFVNVYLSPIVKKALGEDKRIVIVDHSHTGQSIENFVLLWMEYSSPCYISFLNLLTQTQRRVGVIDPRYTQLLGKVTMPDIAIHLFNDGYVRLTPHHQHWKWGESSPSLLENYEQNSEVLKAIELIRNL